MDNNQNNEIEVMLKKLNKGIVFNRVISFVLLACVIATLTVSYITNVKFNTFIETATPAIENLSRIDVDEFNATITTVNKVVDVFKVDELMDTLSKIDFNAFNNVVTNLDVDELNTTLDHMNESYLAIKDVTDKLKPLLQFFGGKQR